MKKYTVGLAMLATLSLGLSSCVVEDGYMTASSISPTQFVSALNNASTGGYSLEKTLGDTNRTGYFVIFNPNLGLFGDYQAINLDFIRSITVFSNNLDVDFDVANAFQGMVSATSLNRNDAEELDFDGPFGVIFNEYISESDGLYSYDFGRGSRDTGLTTAESEGLAIARVAVNLAGKYEMDLEPAAKIAVIGAKVSNMLSEGLSQTEIDLVYKRELNNILGINQIEDLLTEEGQSTALKNTGISNNGLDLLKTDLVNGAF